MMGSVWIVNAMLQWVLLFVILWRGGCRRQPAFTAYIAFNSVKTSALIWVARHYYSQYFSVNWILRLVGLLLLIAVLAEVFAAVFRPYSTLPKRTVTLFMGILGCLVLMAAAIAFLLPGAHSIDGSGLLLVINRSVSITFCGAFVLTAAFSMYLGIPWEQRTYGIGWGFLLFMSIDMVDSSLLAAYGRSAAGVFGVISMLGYSLALITWLMYYLRIDLPRRVPTLQELRRLHRALESSPERIESSTEVT